MSTVGSMDVFGFLRVQRDILVNGIIKIGDNTVIHSGNIVTNLANGLMTKEDKAKLDGISAGANVYTHPTTHPPSIIVQDANNRFMTDVERNKLNGIAAGANVYTHPATHPASIISQDANNRFVTDTEKSSWNNKANAIIVSATAPTGVANGTFWVDMS